jgi:hypothetical protein
MGTERNIITGVYQGVLTVAIYKMVRESAFAPDDIARLGEAYECVLKTLRLVDRDDPVTEIVAKKIIALYEAGDHDPPHVCAQTIRALGIRSV